MSKQIYNRRRKKNAPFSERRLGPGSICQASRSQEQNSGQQQYLGQSQRDAPGQDRKPFRTEPVEKERYASAFWEQSPPASDLPQPPPEWRRVTTGISTDQPLLYQVRLLYEAYPPYPQYCGPISANNPSYPICS